MPRNVGGKGPKELEAEAKKQEAVAKQAAEDSKPKQEDGDLSR